jgi:signal transduction histidine kinase
MILLAITRFARGEHTLAFVELAMSLVGTSVLYFCKVGRLNLAIRMAYMICAGFLFIVSYFKLINLEGLLPPIILFLGVYLLILKTFLERFIYFVIYFILASFTFFNYNKDIIDALPFLLIITATYFAFSYFATYLINQNKKVTRAINDLNLASEQQEKLNKTLIEKNDDLKTFTYIMTHDLKAPLNSISAFSELILKRNDLPQEKQTEYLGYISKSAKNMSGLINDLLIYAKVDNYDELEFARVNLTEVVEEITSKYQREVSEGKIKFEVENLASINGNQDLVNSLLRNLISNSIKYQPKDNEEHVPMVSIKRCQTDGHQGITISDNGIGIKEEFRDKIFLPFKRFHNDKEYEGTGLGLSIVSKVMEKHKGSIEIKETSDRGTTFKLLFSKN